MFQKVAVHTRRNLEEHADFSGIMQKLKTCSGRIFLTENAQAHINEAFPRVDFSDVYDIFVIVGGDGSVLNIARRMQELSTPILPISAGTLGFLAEIPPKDFADVCERIFKKEFSIDKRTLLDVTMIDPEQNKTHFHCLNDAVISQSALVRLASIKTLVNGEYLTTYRADGLIVATPTGSTAYSLSAGGPIVYPRLEAMILTPICPHSISHRSLVIPQEKTIQILAEEDNREDLVLTIDGQEYIPMKTGSRVEIKISEKKLKFYRLPEEHFFKTIKRKMNWGINRCEEVLNDEA